jgi:hypothetical protein
MSNSKESSVMYEVALSGPGMDMTVKLDLRISCKYALLLVMGLDQAMSSSDTVGSFRKILSEEDQTKLEEIKTEILQKSKLEGLHLKLKEHAK